MAAIETIEIPTGDWTFTAKASGPADGRLVLLLHGFPQTSHEWRAQLSPNADSWARHSCDVCGKPCKRRTNRPSAGPEALAVKVQSPVGISMVSMAAIQP